MRASRFAMPLGMAAWLLAASSAASVTTLSTNADDDWEPAISGSHVVWIGEEAGIRHVFSKRGAAAPVRVTESLYTSLADQAQSVAVSGGTVVWQHASGADLYLWDADVGPDIIGLGDPLSFDAMYAPAISGDLVVWSQSDGNDTEIMLWDRSTWDGHLPVTAVPITSNDWDDDYPEISGTRVVWQGRKDGSDFEILTWDGTFPISIQQVTQNTVDDELPDVSGSAIVWQRADASDHDIWYWDGSASPPIAVTADAIEDLNPRIAGSFVVWTWFEPGVGQQTVYWDSGTPPGRTDLSPDTTSLSPDVDDAVVVWSMYDSTGSDYDIVRTTIPEPLAAARALASIAALGGIARVARRGAQSARGSSRIAA